MSEQRGDPAARAIAHDADAPRHAPADPHAVVPHEEAGRPGHGPDDDGAHHAAASDDHDDHEHAGEELGPIDTLAWGAGVVGVALGLVMVLCFALATSALPA